MSILSARGSKGPNQSEWGHLISSSWLTEQYPITGIVSPHWEAGSCVWLGRGLADPPIWVEVWRQGSLRIVPRRKSRSCWMDGFMQTCVNPVCSGGRRTETVQFLLPGRCLFSCVLPSAVHRSRWREGRLWPEPNIWPITDTVAALWIGPHCIIRWHLLQMTHLTVALSVCWQCLITEWP